ncbi:unnamed protein product [Polarella glacialis]|uniref:Uncharacterized protein n=1 Tax=Polarella glacialis TaxID=89957 RepID=A0A813E2I6_POLGL|nr:unnamed protein product [Polarella glacialis]CAE8592182.1 unnamed protein product [Polarella glacialis]
MLLLLLMFSEALIGPFLNAPLRTTLCTRLLELRAERPQSVFEVVENRHLQASPACQISLRVRRTDSLAPIFVQCKDLQALRQKPASKRPKFVGQEVFKLERRRLLSPGDGPFDWWSLTAEIQAQYNGPIAECYNQRIRYILEPSTSADD